MLVIGLTGSMGMGKSTAAAKFRALGFSVFDADANVHLLYEGQLADEIEAAFPGTTVEGRVDRSKLSEALLRAPSRIKELENIVHPRVRENERAFLADEFARGARMAVLEIPLLFETGVDKSVDAVVVVSAPPDVQRRRLLERTGMTEAKLAQLLSRQMPDDEKRSRADFVVDTSGTMDAAHVQIEDIVAKFAVREGTAFERFWK